MTTPVLSPTSATDAGAGTPFEPFADTARLEARLAAARDTAAVTAIVCAWRGPEPELLHALLTQAPVLDDLHVRYCLGHRVDGELLANAPGLTDAQRAWVATWAQAILDQTNVTGSFRQFAGSVAAHLAAYASAVTGVFTPAQTELLETACSGKSASRRTLRQRNALTSLLISTQRLPADAAVRLAGHFLGDEGRDQLLARTDIPLELLRPLILPPSWLEATSLDEGRNPPYANNGALRALQRRLAADRAQQITDRAVLAALMMCAKWSPDDTAALAALVLAAPAEIATPAWHTLMMRSSLEGRRLLMEHPDAVGRCCTPDELLPYLSGEAAVVAGEGAERAQQLRAAAMLAVGFASQGARLWRPAADDPVVVTKAKATVCGSATPPERLFGTWGGQRGHRAWHLLQKVTPSATTFEDVVGAIAAEEELRANQRRSSLWSTDDFDAPRMARAQALCVWADVMLDTWLGREPWIETELALVRAAQEDLVKRVFGATKRKPVRSTL